MKVTNTPINAIILDGEVYMRVPGRTAPGQCCECNGCSFLDKSICGSVSEFCGDDHIYVLSNYLTARLTEMYANDAYAKAIIEGNNKPFTFEKEVL